MQNYVRYTYRNGPRLKERDLKTLYALYRMRTLTIKQIHRLFYSDSTEYYVYKRLGKLSEYNLMHVESKFISGKKTGCCFIREPGIRELKENGYLNGPTRRAFDIGDLSRDQLYYVTQVNQIYTSLEPDGWRFKSGYEVKAEYKLNRRNNILGSLLSPDNVEYGVYIIQPEIKDETIVKILKEIEAGELQSYIVFFKFSKDGTNAYDRFVNMRTKLRVVVAGGIHLLPYNNFGIWIMRKAFTELALVNIFTRYGRVKGVQTTFQNIAPYCVEHNGEEKYIGELLRNDITKVDFIVKQYSDIVYQQHNKKLMLLCWPTLKGQYDRLRALPHIEIVTVENK